MSIQDSSTHEYTATDSGSALYAKCPVALYGKFKQTGSVGYSASAVVPTKNVEVDSYEARCA